MLTDHSAWAEAVVLAAEQPGLVPLDQGDMLALLRIAQCHVAPDDPPRLARLRDLGWLDDDNQPSWPPGTQRGPHDE